MKFIILTLFPEVIQKYLETSIIKNAVAKNLINCEIVNVRKFSLQKNQAVDDYGYGGGPGMVLSVQPFADAIKKYHRANSIVINLSPAGKKFEQKIAKTLAKETEIILICGHYEGIDERIDNYVDITYSIGDYVLTGGEIPALIILDSITRLIPGVINNDSLVNESFNNYLLDYPVYTKPLEYDNHTVPEVLLSGHHQKIKEFRKAQQIKKTKKFRKDLYQKYSLLERKKNEN